MESAEEKALAILETIKQYPSGYRAYPEGHMRPLTKLENELVNVIYDLIEPKEADEIFEYRAAESADGFLDTWGPKGNPNVSWATLEEAERGAALDDALVVRRTRAGAWEIIK